MNSVMMTVFPLVTFVSILLPLALIIFGVYFAIKLLKHLESQKESMGALQKELAEIKDVLKNR